MSRRVGSLMVATLIALVLILVVAALDGRDTFPAWDSPLEES